MVDAVRSRSVTTSKETYNCGSHSGALAEWLLRDDVAAYVDEDIRHAIIIAFLRMLESGCSETLTFPSSLTANERAFVHMVAKLLGLHSQSFGSGQRRFVTVSCMAFAETFPHKIRLPLTWNSRRAISQLLQSNPLTSKERLELHPRTDGNTVLDRGTREERQRGTTGRLMGAVPQVPPAPVNTDGSTDAERGSVSSSIPSNVPSVFMYRNHIIQSLDSNQILVVFGPPGSGKTTYLPQILMESCHDRGHRCRMICTQPRRLYAHINAERLAQLRGETVGQTIGYQIRLESKVSPRTLLTFCTHGVLLRTIYADPGLMSGTTHILVDEIEEDELPSKFIHARGVSVTSGTGTFARDSYGITDALHRNPSFESGHQINPNNGCGILLGLIPSLLIQYPHLKVVLLINLRKTSYDLWKSGSATFPWNADFTRGAKSPIAGDNEVGATRCSQLIVPRESTNDIHHVGIEDSSTSAFRSLDAQVPRGRSVCGATGFPMYPRNLSLYESSTFNCNYLDQAAQPAEPGSFSSRVQSPASALNECPNHARWVEQNKVDLFSSYLSRAPVVLIPFPEQTIKVYHLGEVLQWLNFWNPAMEEASNVLWQDDVRCQVLYHWLTTDQSIPPTVQLSSGDRGSWCGNRLSKLTLFQEMSSPNLQWPDHNFNFNGDVAKPASFSASAIDYRASPHLKEVPIGALPNFNTTFTSNSRQHANNLLWSIWRETILGRGNARTYQKEKCPLNSNTGREIHALITNLHQCILAGWFPVDYQHSQSGLTALMVCAAAGLVDSVDRLLGFGADVFLRVPMPYEILQIRSRGSAEPDQLLMGPKHRRIRIGEETYLMVGVNAHDLARLFGHRQVASILAKHMAAHSLRHIPENWEAVLCRFGSWFDGPVSPSPFSHCILTVDCGRPNGCTIADCLANISDSHLGMSDHDNILLTTYLMARNGIYSDTAVDFDLLVTLLTKLDFCLPEGSILIFLPSYEEIIYLRERLINQDSSPWSHRSKHVVLILHSRMLVADLSRVYAKPPDGYRKIILSSNIAESCMSFDDVRYVIDCGLDCTKDYVPSLKSTVLRNIWISKSIAIQRQTRVGNGQVGLCFRLYSRFRFEYLHDNIEVQGYGHFIEEACIQARLLSPSNIPIQTILESVPRPPETVATCDAIRSLMEMDALDTFQDLTELGYHICDIPIPPRYAKMVLVSVALKCLDPILTIACILAYAEPFVTPKNAAERREMLNARKKFSADTLSDHMLLLRAFQFWQKARSEGWEKSFCQKNFISTAAFEIITVIRTQLLGQLRASGFVKARGSGDIRDLNTNSENWAVVKAALVAGMHANFVRIDRETNKLCPVKHSLMHTVQLHPHSVLATNADGTPVNHSVLPCEWLVYDDMLVLSTNLEPNAALDAGGYSDSCSFSVHSKTADPTLDDATTSKSGSSFGVGYQQRGSCFDGPADLGLIRCATVVSPITIALMAGPMRLRPDLLRLTENAIHDIRTAQLDYQKRQTQLVTRPLVNQSLVIHGPNPLFVDWNPSNSMATQCTRSSSRVPGPDAGESTETAQPVEHLTSDPTDSHSESESEEIWSTLMDSASQDPNHAIDSSCSGTYVTTSRDSLSCGTSLPNVKSLQTQNYLPPTVNSIPTNLKTPSLLSGPANSDYPHGSTECELVPLRFDDNELLHFKSDPVAAQLILALRQKWQALLLRRLRNPGKQSSQQDESTLSVLVTVLTSEEQVLGLRQPSGVGARPRPMAAELCNQYESNIRMPTLSVQSKFNIGADQPTSQTTFPAMANQSFGCTPGPIRGFSAPFSHPNLIGIQPSTTNDAHCLGSGELQTQVDKHPLFAVINELSEARDPESVAFGNDQSPMQTHFLFADTALNNSSKTVVQAASQTKGGPVTVRTEWSTTTTPSAGLMTTLRSSPLVQTATGFDSLPLPSSTTASESSVNLCERLIHSEPVLASRSVPNSAHERTSSGREITDPVGHLGLVIQPLMNASSSFAAVSGMCSLNRIFSSSIEQNIQQRPTSPFTNIGSDNHKIGTVLSHSVNGQNN